MILWYHLFFVLKEAANCMLLLYLYAERLADFSSAGKLSCYNHWHALEAFCTISLAKMNRSKPDLTGRIYVRKITHKKIWVPIAQGASCSKSVPFCVGSPFDPLWIRKTADFGIEWCDCLLIYACHPKYGEFLHVGGGVLKKWDFWHFGDG